MNNIFEGAKFGDKFVTRDGKTILVYLCNNGQHAKLSTDKGNIYEFTMNGLFDIYELKQSGKDIVSHYQEPIDEDELDELADDYYLKQTMLIGKAYRKHVRDIFIDGYRKAMEGKV